MLQCERDKVYADVGMTVNPRLEQIKMIRKEEASKSCTVYTLGIYQGRNILNVVLLLIDDFSLLHGFIYRYFECYHLRIFSAYFPL